MIVTVWLLIGLVSSSGDFHVAAPSPALFANKESCEAVLRATSDVAKYAKLRCVEAKVMK